ncbi:phosphatidylserine decarboxylase [Bradyrhizobium sp.]|uniref:phosphatidylserine decarboxylase n=1 Tax=Bradyrhizobium sp. TaxID=376 RepID=UPI001EC34C40|nr:phosphatidylserine decarboxylase [Bradyrhizobium sp.]MBV8688445.1 phosphatidylserine decarboxylase [Alphaproteobacteria bacterium]MBV9373065.1 phosphatidylserine decarboxylase [Alphaproteobacteria bacterium]MBV9979113.1 phosphatidylserine decarboxylase [Bradyrhizobium sp.]
MTSLEKSDLVTTNVRYRMPAVHPEGRKFVVVAVAIALVFWFLIDWDWLGWIMAGVSLWVAAFFRDPIRTTPKGEGLIIAPADGMVTMIASVPPPRELAGEDGLGEAPMTRVSIFMSVFDVHINRAPVAGEIKRVVYIAGKFLNADLDKASEDNERQHFLVEASDGTRIGFTQIAGLVARRIVPWVKAGDYVTAGQRVGLIRFGSRVDVYLPAGTASRILLGQRTIAGETVIAKLGEAAVLEGVAQ